MKPRFFAMVVLVAWMMGAQAADAMRLVGTVLLSPGSADPSHAVFETADGRQLIVEAGQEIDGCTLTKVGPRRAIMDCAEGLVSLTLRSDLRSRLAPPEVQDAIYQITLPRETFALALDDRRRIASQASLEPEVRDGWMYGYRVNWLAPGGDFQRLGLREGDVVISLNGTPASAPGPFMQAVNGLRGQAAFQFTVERSGRLIAYSYLLD
jgi:type II secretion system protein C